MVLYYKIGDEPGGIALVNCESAEEALTLAGQQHSGSKRRAFRV